jgi:hypothetical protein
MTGQRALLIRQTPADGLIKPGTVEAAPLIQLPARERRE